LKSRIAIVAALEREVRPLTRNWKREAAVDGVTVYSSEKAIVAYAGIGAERAEVATGVALSYGPVHQVISVGWAGALHEGIHSGAVQKVGSVIDARNGQVFETYEANGNGGHSTVLVTLDHVASAREKKRLHDKLSADLVDMEAAAVARVAERRGIPFLAVKAVSDDHEFDFPGMEKFTTPEGRFREAAFAAYVALRPALWKSVARMASQSAIAAKNLCSELERYLAWEEEHVRA
jgi:adenosylhomocysteine nucleosidase